MRLGLLALVAVAASHALHGQSAATLLNVGSYREAREQFEAALPAGEAVEGYFETFLQTDDIQAGLEQAAALLDRWPGNPFLAYAHGRLLAASGQLEEAEIAYRDAITAKSDYWRAGLALAELYTQTGQSREARRICGILHGRYKQGLLTTAIDLGVAGRAAVILEEFHDANEALRVALELDATNVQLLLWRAQLFTRTYDDAFARELYEEALAVNANRPELYTGLAEVAQGFAQKERLIQQALGLAPGFAPALTAQAQLTMLDGNYQQASFLLERALTARSTHLPALSRLGAVRYLQGDSAAVGALEETALRLNPEGAAFYRAMSEDLALRFRYPAAVAFARKGVQIDPGDPAVNAELGTGLMRLGRFREARPYLERSYERDAFNLFVSNTLNLLDAYEEFVELESTNVRLFIHREESSVLGPMMLAQAEAAIAAMRSRYPYRWSGKIRVEAYNDPDDFAVRVAGIPHIGLLGVSFGNTIALNTPRAQRRDYNWARTLWHEIAHTMAIGVSRHHVPRWLTEGLSVYEEALADPAWKRKLEPALLRAFEQDKLHTLEEMDRGFTRPEFPRQVLLSYFHASELVSYVVERHGFGAIIAILQNLARGMDEESAIREATGSSRADLDAAFRRSLQQRLDSLAPVLKLLPDPFAEELTGKMDSPLVTELEEGRAAIAGGRHDSAEAALRRALDMYPLYVGPDNAYQGLAEVYRAINDDSALMDILERYLAVTEYGAEEARELAALYADREDPDRAIAHLERSRAAEPYQHGCTPDSC